MLWKKLLTNLFFIFFSILMIKMENPRGYVPFVIIFVPKKMILLNTMEKNMLESHPHFLSAITVIFTTS